MPFSTSPCAAGPSICARLSDDVSLADFAVLADLSPHHFGRAFKASTGTPPQVRFRRLRLEQARAAVLGTDRGRSP